MNLPVNRSELCERWEKGERFTFLLFYGHKPPEQGVDASCFSQWFIRPFEIDGITYNTAEHWMMAEKARLFNDSVMLERILETPGPREAKAFGRKVQGFDPVQWDAHKFEIVCAGNRAKFSQHDDLKEYLLATRFFTPSSDKHAESSIESVSVREKMASYTVTPKDVVLVEAAGRDTIWGIGLGEKNPKAQDPNLWRGHNLLGFALTVVREELLTQDES